MKTWIFQANPDDYDIDGYLSSRPAQVVWLVTRYASEIAVGDCVYLWRSQGKRKAISGVVAQAIVTARPELRGEDPEGVRFWREQGPRSSSPQIRAAMRLVKVASAREVIKADWCVEDPVLRELPNLKMRARTNYPTSLEQAARLDALWARTGRDWNRSESVAGLLAYSETYGMPVSRLPGSPVARAAITAGRAVGGMYAKVMNFRSLDPRATGSGMSGASDTDREVWQEFFDAQLLQVREGALKEEFARLWGAEQSALIVPPELEDVTDIIEDEAARLRALSLDELLAKYRAQESLRVARPPTRALTAREYDRNPLVVTIARARASNRCEIHNCLHPTFETAVGMVYTEVHHIVPLANGGEDTIDNVACLCPAHHREIHLGRKSKDLTAWLREIRGSKTR